MQTLGDRIRAARDRKGYSQAQLSHVLGSSSTALVSNWERNISKPDTDRLSQLCLILDVSPAFIIGLSEDMQTLSATTTANNYELELSREDISLIKRLRDIDDNGRSLIMTVINHEHHRCRAKPNSDTFPPKSDELLPLFLYKKDPGFDNAKEKAKTLRTIKKDTGASVEGITRFLWTAGYSELLSMSDVVSILRGAKVPSPRLYDYIYAYLTKNYHISID